MVAKDEDALVCDFMETYGVMDWRALPVRYAATLASGFRDDSRIKMAISGAKCKVDTLLLATAVDALNWMIWVQTEDGQKGRNKPERIAPALAGDIAYDDGDGFATIEEYEAARAKLLEG